MLQPKVEKGKNMNEKIIITLNCGNGDTRKCELLRVFKADNGKDYAALSPIDSGAEKEIEFFSASPMKNNSGSYDYAIQNIIDEKETAYAKNAYAELSAVAPTENYATEADEISVDMLQSVSFVNDKGEAEEWKLVDVFDLNNRKYVALISVAEVKNSDRSNVNIHLMRAKPQHENIDGEQEYDIMPIISDMEYEEAERAFARRVNGSEN